MIMDKYPDEIPQQWEKPFDTRVILQNYLQNKVSSCRLSMCFRLVARKSKKNNSKALVSSFSDRVRKTKFSAQVVWDN